LGLALSLASESPLQGVFWAPSAQETVSQYVSLLLLLHPMMLPKHADDGFILSAGVDGYLSLAPFASLVWCWVLLGHSGFGLIQLLPPVVDSGSWSLYESRSLCGSWLKIRFELDSVSSMACLGIHAASRH